MIDEGGNWGAYERYNKSEPELKETLGKKWFFPMLVEIYAKL